MNKTELKKMKKDELVNLLLTIQNDMAYIKDAVDKLDVLYTIKDRLDNIDDSELSAGKAVRLKYERGYIHDVIETVEGVGDE